MKMAQQQHILCGASGRSKPSKPKKVPQRGLGVAQLEKIRVEEQRKKLEALEAATTTYETVPCLHPASSLSAAARPGSDWAVASNLDGDKHLAFAFWPQTYGSSSSVVPPRLYQFQTNSGLNSQIEPPSNQSSGHAHTPSEECCKIFGTKRPCPFPLDDPHGHFHPNRHSEAMSKYMSCSSNQRCLNQNDTIGKLGADFLTLAPPLAISPENTERRMASPNRAMSLFPVRPQMESRSGEGGKGEEAIDLNLRL